MMMYPESSEVIKIHEHGKLQLLSVMGSDSSICDAARISYGTGTKTVNDDRNLIRYLMRNRHTSPFEMGECLFYIKMPIFVMRQWIRHRTANVNEYSGRYSEMSNEFYIPYGDYVQAQSQSNNQGREGVLSELLQNNFSSRCVSSSLNSYDNYKMNLEEGYSRELSRIILPVSNYTECYWKIDLHNLFHFLKLRMDHHAQREIRDYANAMFGMVKEKFPLATEAFEDYVLNSVTLSREEYDIIRNALDEHWLEKSHKEELEESNLSKREKNEFIERWIE